MVERSSFVQKLLFLFFLLLPFQFALSPSEGVDLAISRVAVLVIGGFFLLERLRNGSWMLPAKRDLFLFMGFIFLAGLSLLWAREPLWTLRKVFFLISFLPLWFLLSDIFVRRGAVAVRDVASGFFFGAVASALVALLQFFSQFVFSLERVLDFWLSRIYPIFLGEAFAQSVAIHPSLLVNIAGKTILRAVGAFPDPHVAAFYFGMAIPFGVWLGMTAVPTKRAIFFLGTGILFLADLCTFSRGGYVGLFAMLIFFGAFAFSHMRERISFRQKKKVALVVMIILLFSLLIAPVRNRLMDTLSVAEGSNRARIALWGEAIFHIKERPLLGYGLGNYPLQVKPSTEYREPIYIHNIYLDIWAELGIVGLMLFLGIFLYPVCSFFFRGSFQSIAFPAVLALVLFLVHSFFENILFSVHIFPVLLSLIATIAWQIREQGAESREQRTESMEHGTGSREQGAEGSAQAFLEKIFIGALLAVPLLVVFAAEKAVFFDIPLYVPEAFIVFALGSLLVRERSFRFIHPCVGILSLALLLIAVGLGIGVLSNDMTLHGYGRIKSWFVFPLLYGGMLAFSLRRKMVVVEDILRSVFFGGILVGISVVLSILLGGGFSYDHRLHGFFSSPNQLALLLGTAVITGVFLVISLWEKLGKERLFISFGILFLGMLLFLTQSYTVLFSLMAVTGIGIVAHRHRFSRKQGALFFLGCVLCIGILLPISASKWHSILSFDDRSSLASRGMIWRSALRMIEDHPLIGIGPGNFQERYIAYQKYFPPYLEWSAPHPHNSFLDLWLEGGLLAVIGFALFFWHWLISSARAFFSQQKESAVRALPFLLGIYFFLTGLTDVPFLGNDLAYFFATAFVASHFLLCNPRDVSDRSSHRDD